MALYSRNCNTMPNLSNLMQSYVTLYATPSQFALSVGFNILIIKRVGEEDSRGGAAPPPPFADMCSLSAKLACLSEKYIGLISGCGYLTDKYC